MITLFQTEYLNRLDSRYVARRSKMLQMQTGRLVKASLRKSRRSYMAWRRQQYFLSAAYGDMKASICRNEDIFIAVAVIAAALGYAYAALVAEMVFTFFLTAYTLSEVSGANILLFSIVAAGSLATTLAWVMTFLLNSMAIAIMQGANRNKNRSVIGTLRLALRYVSRTTTSLFLLLASLALPVAVALIFTLIYIVAFIENQSEALTVMPYGIIAAVTGVLLMLLHYSLVPVVALFEPKLTYKEVFTRSRELVSRRGRMFILAAYGLLAAVMSAAYGLSLLLENLFGLNNILAFTLMGILAAVYLNGVMTMFYRKRRLARVH